MKDMIHVYLDELVRSWHAPGILAIVEKDSADLNCINKISGMEGRKGEGKGKGKVERERERGKGNGKGKGKGEKREGGKTHENIYFFVVCFKCRTVGCNFSK
jgi:hypothetical protein